MAKYLIRDLLRVMRKEKEKYRAFCMQGLGISSIEFDFIQGMLSELKASEKLKDTANLKKDYSEVLDIMLKDVIFARIVRLRVGELLEKFESGDYGRISEPNKACHHATLNYIYESTNKLLAEETEKHEFV